MATDLVFDDFHLHYALLERAQRCSVKGRAVYDGSKCRSFLDYGRPSISGLGYAWTQRGKTSASRARLKASLALFILRLAEFRYH